MKNSESSAGGYIMLAIMLGLLAAPVAVGHFMLKSESVETKHADASLAQ